MKSTKADSHPEPVMNAMGAFGEHIIRNNVIRRCGQAGIAGQKGATRSLISGYLIEDTNYRREIGGWETAAIKLTGFALQDSSRGAVITFSVTEAALRVKGPEVNASLVGVFRTVGQTIENRDGRPIAVERDINGKEFSPPIAGPLAELNRGRNAIRWP